MKYPFVSIMPLIDEIRNELKTITKVSSFSDEDMYGWAVDAARLIGTALYEEDEVQITVNKNVCKIPEDFYLLNNIFLCVAKELSYTTAPLPGHMEPITWCRSKIMRPADSSTRVYCTSKCVKGDLNDLSYKLKIPPGIARFSFHTGKIEMHYERLVKGEDGAIMMQDEVNSLNAAKAHVKVMLLQEKYILQEIPRYIYQDILQERDSYIEKAQTTLKFPSQADMYYKAVEQDARFRKFRYKDQ